MNLRLTLPITLALTLLCLDGSRGEGRVPASRPIDATLYTSYFFNPDLTTPSWVVCGSTENTIGCYGSGNLGPFGKVGSMLEGKPRTTLSTNTVTRAIYVLDVAAGVNQNGVTLYVYAKTDVITPDSDRVTVTLTNTIPLALTGGISAKGFMAANGNFLLLGTDQSPSALSLDKRSFSIKQFGPYTENLSSISADPYGYLTAVFDGIFFQLGPDGTDLGGGGGSWFLLNTVQGVPATFP